MVTTVWSPTTRRHEPKAEVWVGVPRPAPRSPSASTRSSRRRRRRGWPLVEATPTRLRVFAAVHDQDFLDHLETIHAEWMRSGIPELVGQDRVVPYMFATDAMRGGLPAR